MLYLHGVTVALSDLSHVVAKAKCQCRTNPVQVIQQCLSQIFKMSHLQTSILLNHFIPVVDECQGETSPHSLPSFASRLWMRFLPYNSYLSLLLLLSMVTPHKYSLGMMLYGRQTGIRRTTLRLFTNNTRKLLRPLYSSVSVQSPRKSWLHRQYSTRASGGPKKTSWYPIPIYVGIGWIACVHLAHKLQQRTRESEDGSRGMIAIVDGPLHVRVYASLPLRFLSRLWGNVHSVNVPTILRRPLYLFYSYVTGCNIDEMEQPNLEEYPNLAAFFYRTLKPGLRVMDRDAAVVSPADGRVLNFGVVEDDRIEQVKGITYSLDAFLGYNPEAKHTPPGHSYVARPGYALHSVVIYLAPGDYHRFHSPTEWKVKRIRHFAGFLNLTKVNCFQFLPGWPT